MSPGCLPLGQSGPTWRGLLGDGACSVDLTIAVRARHQREPAQAMRGSTRRSLVEPIDAVAVAAVDDRPLDLERRRQLALGLREVALEDLEALDLLDPGEARVDRVDVALQDGADGGVGRHRREVGRDAEVPGELR